MEIIRSVESYMDLLNRAKTINRFVFTNNYMDVRDVKRLVDLKRLHYRLDQTGLYLYVDEGQYDKLFVHLLKPNISSLTRRDKPLLLKTVYQNKEKTQQLCDIERLLREKNFFLFDSSLQMKIVAKDICMGTMARKNKMEERLNKDGFHLMMPNISCLEEIKEIKERSNELSIFHFEYRTKQELLDNIRDGNVRCIVNADGKICAVQTCILKYGTLIEDWIAVTLEYKRKGLGKLLLYASFLDMLQKNIDVCFAWVVKTNRTSLEFHKNNGYTFTGLAVDEWVLE